MSREKKESSQPLSDEVREELPEKAQDYIGDLEAENARLRAEIEKLKGQLLMNSHNSSKPPSSDGLKKPKTIPGSQRRSSGRKPGGQVGHAGSTLKARENPDARVHHALSQCAGCQLDLSGVPALGTEDRQSFDLPPIQIQVTEHRAEIKICPCCGTKSTAPFPLGVDARVGYGPNLKGFALYLQHQQLIPPRRVRDILQGILGHRLSIGSVMLWSEVAFVRLAPFAADVVGRMIRSAVAHFDETSMRCEGDKSWLHSASTEKLTFFGIHRRRGTEAMIGFDILPHFRGTAIHDHWDPYFTFEQCSHGLCNSHILRELLFVEEVCGEKWACFMAKLLNEIHGRVQEAKARGQIRLNLPTRLGFLEQYERILKQGYRLHRSDPALGSGTRGPKKQCKQKNLLDRLRNRCQEILRFMTDFEVPFTNNLSEQDIRMNKVKLKISGCFRSFEGAEIFCRIRTYFSTWQKNGQDIIQAAQAIFRGQPLMLQA